MLLRLKQHERCAASLRGRASSRLLHLKEHERCAASLWAGLLAGCSISSSMRGALRVCGAGLLAGCSISSSMRGALRVCRAGLLAGCSISSSMRGALRVCWAGLLAGCSSQAADLFPRCFCEDNMFTCSTAVFTRKTLYRAAWALLGPPSLKPSTAKTRPITCFHVASLAAVPVLHHSSGLFGNKRPAAALYCMNCLTNLLSVHSVVLSRSEARDALLRVECHTHALSTAGAESSPHPCGAPVQPQKEECL
ncbi:hypothetical protein NDU88_004803 [Pleurodeles waltl]|uniref:Uncharacterized protein n=1 Tax=Pleurodeles waltl TaxID=8319 RepID=A0AAV7V4L0_PLEWA|nr:hypothetical protein NDU88_004803 [Pleurodeles waltl]